MLHSAQWTALLVASVSCVAHYPSDELAVGIKNNGAPIQVNGIFPGITATASSEAVRSESGTGALMPWAGQLWMVSYLSVPNAGSGSGFYTIYPNMTMEKLHTHDSCYANRMIHPKTNQIVIGPYVVDTNATWRIFKPLLKDRIGGMAEHILNPDEMVYMLSMDGPLYEANVVTMEVNQLSDLVVELGIPKAAGEQPHFKAMHTINDRVFAVSNTFEPEDYVSSSREGAGYNGGGRLASWDGKNSTKWQVDARTAFVEVTGRRNFGRVTYATGWDAASAILRVLDPANPNGWQVFRLPKASHAYDHLWQTEWPRIREVETERYLMDAHGMFYELSPLGWAGATWGVRPVCQHLRMIPDFTSFRGMLVLGGNQVTPIFDNNLVTGQPQAGLWFGKTDDLWGFGKPRGWGGPWRRENVTSGQASDPYLMTGFDKKTLHLRMYGDTDQVKVTVQVDFTGASVSGNKDSLDEPWSDYQVFSLTRDKPYAFHVFPDGFSAHWVRAVSDTDATLTAYFHYT